MRGRRHCEDAEPDHVDVEGFAIRVVADDVLFTDTGPVDGRMLDEPELC